MMNTWNDFEAEAQLAEKTTRAQEPQLVLLLQDSIGLFADAFAIMRIPEESDHRFRLNPITCSD